MSQTVAVSESQCMAHLDHKKKDQVLNLHGDHTGIPTQARVLDNFVQVAVVFTELS